MILGAAAVAAAVWVGVVGVESGHAFAHDAVPVLLLPIGLWLLLSERYELTLGVCLIYLSLLDGPVRLLSGSSSATLGRDIVLYAIVLGALMRVALRKDRVTLPRFTGFVLAWIAVCAMLIANPADVSITHAIAGLRPHLEFVPLFFLAYYVLRTERRLHGLLL